MQIEPEVFTAEDLEKLRRELRASGLDSWQAGELLGAFLEQRGYGVSQTAVRSAAARIESVGCSLESMRQELSQLARMM